jgi:hypothetical protein
MEDCVCHKTCTNLLIHLQNGWPLLVWSEVCLKQNTFSYHFVANLQQRNCLCILYGSHYIQQCALLQNKIKQQIVKPVTARDHYNDFSYSQSALPSLCRDRYMMFSHKKLTSSDHFQNWVYMDPSPHTLDGQVPFNLHQLYHTFLTGVQSSSDHLPQVALHGWAQMLL